MKSITEIFNKMPYFIDPCAEEATAIYFLILPENQLETFNAVKNSTLPEDLIDYLIENGTFKKVLTKAGFCFESISGKDTTLEACVFRKVLDKYNEDFLKIIALYVSAGSYIESEAEDGLRYRWTFDGITCKKIYPRLVWD